MFNGILAMIEAVQKIHSMTAVSWWKGGGNSAKILTDMFVLVGDVVGGWQMKYMLQNVAQLIKGLPNMDKGAATGFKTAMDLTTDMIKKAGDFGTYMWKENGDVAMRNLKKTMNWMEKNECLPSQVISSIVTEAAAIAEIMDKIGTADLGDIHLKPMMEGILGFDGEQKFTVEAKGVNLGVKLNIVIDSEKLAESIVKGTIDKDGFFETTDAAAKGLLDGDKGMKKWFDNRTG
tara:strand:- start:347 stop:1045 length:699 start_codon:yes stop_codon:yes gene_type:complete